MRAIRTIAKLLAACVLVPASVWAQTANLDTLASQGAVVRRDGATGLLGFVGTTSADARLSPALVPGDPAANATALLSRFAPHLGIADADQVMALQRVRSGAAGSTARFQQTYKGVPVFAGTLIVNTDAAGALRAIAGKTTDKKVDTAAGINAAAASAAALAAVARKYSVPAAALRASSPQLWVYDPRLMGLLARNAGLVWRMTVTSASRARVAEVVLVDAARGSIALSYSQVHRARDRITYDTNSTSILPGTLECTEATDPCTAGTIPDADNAHQYAADVYDFYFTRFGRDAIDGLGSPIVSTTRYCDPDECPMVNAFWSDDIQQMVYGEGMVADDVAAHEITHGITAHESALIYFGESGAINESLSDIFGEFIDQVNGHGTDTPAVKWLMGEDTYIGAIRSMSNPPAFGQPDRKMSPNWYTGGQDEGGVHENSGVGNKAAFLIVDGGTFNGKTVAGIGLEKAAQIYYEAQTMLLTSGSNYADLYNALFQACTNLTGQFGITASNCAQVRLATQATEMNLTALTSTAVPYCPAGSSNLQVLGVDDFENPTNASGSLNRFSVGTRWFLDSNLSTSGTYSALAQSVPTVSDSSLVYQILGTIAVGDRILFNHTLDLEYRYDGAVVEYSINGGTTWVDSRPLRVGGQDYNATIVSSAPFANNPLYPRSVYTGFASSWLYTLYDLTPLVGKTVQWRFRAGTDGTGAGYGWNVDDIYHYRCDAGTFTLTSDVQSVSESVGSAIVTVSRGDGGAGAATVTYATSNGSAVSGTDYTTKTGTLSWAAGDAHPKTVLIPIMNRAGTQAARSFTLTLTGATGGTLGIPTAQTITIDDFDGHIQFASPGVVVAENGPNVTLTVTRTGFAGPAASVTWTTAAQTATAASDFTTKTGTLTWEAGDSSPRTITIGPVVATGAYIPIVNDPTIESPETFLVNLSAPTGAALGAVGSATVTIASEDAGVTMGAATMSVNESDGTIHILANRAGPSVGAASVNYTITNGTAVRGTHFNSAAAAGTLNWADGDSTPKSVDITLVDNAAINPNRTFTVALAGAVGLTLAAPMSTVVTIKDDDNTVQFSVATAVVAETTANLMLTVARTGIATGAADVTWTAHNGTAIAGTDFGILANVTEPTGTLHWNAGDLVSKPVSVPIINNAIASGARTFTVQLSGESGPNLTLGGNSAVTVTLNDDEKSVTLPSTTYTVQEMVNPSVSIVLKRGGPATTAITATWTTVNGNAISGTDFGVLNNAAARTGTVTWAVSDSADKTITIPILNNSIGGQPPRLFTVVVTPGAGVVLVGSNTATVTINDDDIPPQTSVQFAQPKYIVLENVGNATLTLTRTDLGPGCASPSQVTYATQPGTALATSDYTTKTGTVQWSAIDGCVDKQITVAIVNNTVAEPPESFTVVLSGNNPGTGLGTPATATVTILDDDEVFPAQCAMPAGFSTPGGVTAGWHVTTEVGAYEGACALRTDQIDDSETAGLEMNGTFVAGNVSFRVKISSEPTFDKLTFYVDGVPQPMTWSGTAATGWTVSPNYPLTAGVHALRWVYEKDASASVGMDAAFIDGLVTPAFTP